MVVVTLTNCPESLRGDLTKWLLEISTGVYVGNISARVRDQLWDRIRSCAKSGRATMTFSINNEQKLDFRLHNSDWIPMDFDGIKLIMHPNPSHLVATNRQLGYSNASKYRMAQKNLSSRTHNHKHEDRQTGYVVLDIETTGLSLENDMIIEIAALRIRNDEVSAEFDALISVDVTIPASIEKLTGITQDMLITEGQETSKALASLIGFIGNDTIVAYNSKFDMGFINNTLEKQGMQRIDNPTKDALALAKQKLYNLPSHRLSDVAEYFGIQYKAQHRSLADCKTTFKVFKHLCELK